MNFKTATFAAIATSFAAQVFAGPVNINTADAQALDQELIGVGPVLAERVIAWRETHGPFQSKAQLAQVKGIGEAKLELNAADILLKRMKQGRLRPPF